MKKVILVLSIGLILFGIGFVLYPKVDDIKFYLSQRQHLADVRSADAGQDIPVPDGAVCVLSIPKIGLELNVFEGTTPEVLEQGPGHYEETALPGQEGNCCVAGHRNISGSPFADLDKLEQGDELIIYTRNGKFVYQVREKKIIVPTDLSVIEQSQDNILTLTTCQREGSALNRLIIVGQLV